MRRLLLRSRDAHVHNTLKTPEQRARPGLELQITSRLTSMGPSTAELCFRALKNPFTKR